MLLRLSLREAHTVGSSLSGPAQLSAWRSLLTWGWSCSSRRHSDRPLLWSRDPGRRRTSRAPERSASTSPRATSLPANKTPRRRLQKRQQRRRQRRTPRGLKDKRDTPHKVTRHTQREKCEPGEGHEEMPPGESLCRGELLMEPARPCRGNWEPSRAAAAAAGGGGGSTFTASPVPSPGRDMHQPSRRPAPLRGGSAVVASAGASPSSLGAAASRLLAWGLGGSGAGRPAEEESRQEILSGRKSPLWRARAFSLSLPVCSALLAFSSPFFFLSSFLGLELGSRTGGASPWEGGFLRFLVRPGDEQARGIHRPSPGGGRQSGEIKARGLGSSFGATGEEKGGSLSPNSSGLAARWRRLLCPRQELLEPPGEAVAIYSLLLRQVALGAKLVQAPGTSTLQKRRGGGEKRKPPCRWLHEKEGRGGGKALQGLARRQLLSEPCEKAATERSEQMPLSRSHTHTRLQQANEINSNAAAGRQGP